MKKIILFMFVLSCLFVLQPYEAQAAEYKSTELKIRGFDAQTMYSGKNKLHVIEHCEEENEDDIFEYHCEIKDTIISKNKIIRQRTIKCNDMKWQCAGFEDDCYYVVSRDDKKSSKVCKTVKIYNKKAKLISSYKIKIPIKILNGSNPNIGKIRKIKNKLYYTVSAKKRNEYYEYFQCYDLKKKKILFSVEYDRYFYTKLVKNKLYTMLENEIVEYNSKGKIINRYELPEGNRFVEYYISQTENTDEHLFFDFDVNGRYIYYCNQNGVYSCDTKGSKTFELMYDSTGDKVFWPDKYKEFRLDEFKVMKNGDFYIQLSTDGSADTSISTRYYKKLN
ncbi:MAG: hypothetical protein E7267_04200 [Lachnospiraceae bacterium]|nr:hypothetical protein [Lachnospiraceae bacterium]